jgi:diadenosine tetraphosphate (Ap4A) HIT family hydrolase
MQDMNCSICKILHDQVFPGKYTPIYQFDFSVAVLAPNQYYPGRCELWYHQHAVELFQLTEVDRKGYMDDLAVLSQAIYNLFQPVKLNYEILGNSVPHLHCHLIPRYSWDPFPGHPVWVNPQYKAAEQKPCMADHRKVDIAARIAQEIQTIQLQSSIKQQPNKRGIADE